MATTLQGPIGSQTDAPLSPYCGSKTVANATGDLVITPPSRAIRVGGAGALALTYASGVTDTITIAAGETLPAQVTGIAAAGSTATAITVFW